MSFLGTHRLSETDFSGENQNFSRITLFRQSHKNSTGSHFHFFNDNITFDDNIFVLTTAHFGINLKGVQYRNANKYFRTRTTDGKSSSPSSQDKNEAKVESSNTGCSARPSTSPFQSQSQKFKYRLLSWSPPSTLPSPPKRPPPLLLCPVSSNRSQMFAF